MSGCRGICLFVTGWSLLYNNARNPLWHQLFTWNKSWLLFIRLEKRNQSAIVNKKGMHNSKTKTVSTFPWIFIPVHICNTFILNLALISLRNCNLSEDLGCFHLEQSKIKDSSKLQWSKTNNRRKDIVPIQLLNSGVGYNLFSHLCLIWLSHAGLKDYLIAFQCACLL